MRNTQTAELGTRLRDCITPEPAPVVEEKQAHHTSFSSLFTSEEHKRRVNKFAHIAGGLLRGNREQREFAYQETLNKAFELFARGAESALELVPEKDRDAETERLEKEYESQAKRVADKCATEGTEFLAAIAEVQQEIRDEEQASAYETAKKDYLAGRKPALALPPDAQWWNSSEGRPMTQAEAYDFVFREGEKFAANEPRYHKCSQNAQAFTKLIETMGWKIVTASAYAMMFGFLFECGLLKEKPAAPAVEDALPAKELSEKDKERAERHKNMTPEEKRRDSYLHDPVITDMRNPSQTLTAWDLDQLSADDFRRAHGWSRGSNAGPGQKMIVPMHPSQE
jgi:hypothetical protein